MRRKERILIAGAGAIVPMAISFLAIDARNIVDNLDIGVVIGYALRGIVLFALGAITGLLNLQVHDRKTLFQLGIAAPAIVGGLIVSAPQGGGKAPLETAKLPMAPSAMTAMPVDKAPVPFAVPTPQSIVHVRAAAPAPRFALRHEDKVGTEAVTVSLSTTKAPEAAPPADVPAAPVSTTPTEVMANMAQPVFMPWSAEAQESNFGKNIGRGFFGR